MSSEEQQQQNDAQTSSSSTNRPNKAKKLNSRLRTVFFFDNLAKEFFTMMKIVAKDKYFGYSLSEDPLFKSSDFRLRLFLHQPQKGAEIPNLFHLRVVSDELEKMTKLCQAKPFNNRLETNFLFDPFDTTNCYNTQFKNCMNPQIKELKASLLDNSVHTQLNYYIIDKPSHSSPTSLVCIEADDNFFPNILDKTKKYQQTPKSVWEIIGEIFVCGEFILRISEIQYQNRPAGYTVDIEYTPCIMNDFTQKMLRQFTESLFEKTKFEYEKETKQKIDWKTKLQTTLSEREPYALQYSLALGKRKAADSMATTPGGSKTKNSPVSTPTNANPKEEVQVKKET